MGQSKHDRIVNRIAKKEGTTYIGVATPHEDIREGRLAEAVFAANLWAVVQNTAPEVYLDPRLFEPGAAAAASLL